MTAAKTKIKFDVAWLTAVAVAALFPVAYTAIMIRETVSGTVVDRAHLEAVPAAACEIGYPNPQCHAVPETWMVRVDPDGILPPMWMRVDEAVYDRCSPGTWWDGMGGGHGCRREPPPDHTAGA